MFERILVPLDGSRFAELALPHALSLAGRWTAAIELVIVASPMSAPQSTQGVVGDESRDRARRLAGDYLVEVEGRTKAAGFTGAIGRTVMPAGNVANSLVRHAIEIEADLTVMTTHGRGPVQRAWLGSSTDGFIRASPTPVFLVRPEGAPDGRRIDLGTSAGATSAASRILVPLDGSASAERLLPLVRPFAGADTTIILFRAVPPFTAGGSPYLPHVVRDEREHEKVREAAVEYLEGLAEGLRSDGLTAETQVVTAGQPAVAILRTAEEGAADLIAMSTSGRGGVSRLLLGSVADKVVRACPVPMLLYRKPEEG